MRLLYFAWVRETIGIPEEDATPPAGVDTVAALLEWLAARGEPYAKALADSARIRVAVNQEAVGPDHPVAAGDEIAVFPPVTGGAR